MTASDFHKALRNITEQRQEPFLKFSLDDIARHLELDASFVLDHLHVLETLGLIEYHDETKMVFSLTESGLLANLP